MPWVIENIVLQVSAVVNALALALFLVDSLLKRHDAKEERKSSAAKGIIKVSLKTVSRDELEGAHRYNLMAGWADAVDQEENKNRMRDRLLYGERYLSYRDGKAFANPARIVRFMVEVCDLSFKSAEAAARSVIAAQKPYEVGKKASERTVAAQLFAESEDVFEAVAIAEFLYEGHEIASAGWTFWYSVHWELRNSRLKKPLEEKWIA